ncbi:MAG: DUF2075 domain-containing protein [Candidatus Methanomethylophilaceae archaeon]|nr:DUF2075 domain-containing protein [Candidatus Methanomethylophilaceae archaeon]
MSSACPVIMRISAFPFDKDGRESLRSDEAGTDWPVVYMISNDSEAYIGETCSMHNRMQQHLQNGSRRSLKELSVISDERFNKSAVLDIEQMLIRHCGADGRFRLQNISAGQSASHQYYQREMYARMLPEIWERMKEHGLVKSDLDSVRNSNLFKYSPYTSLTSEQMTICGEVLSDILEKLSDGKNGRAVIHGSAGTGKTVLAINMMFTLANLGSSDFDVDVGMDMESGDSTVMRRLSHYVKEHGHLKIGLVVPMTSLRKTLEIVFRDSGNGLTKQMVLGPSEVVDGDYDVLLVDESHRLSRRRNISYMGSYDNVCHRLGMDPAECTQLDWIVASSRYTVLFYDEDQTVKGSDITSEQFETIIGDDRMEFRLTSQLRCASGDEYPLYLDRVFRCVQAHREGFDGYDLRLFDDVGMMVDSIKDLDGEYGLCRTVAGYAWKWISKGLTREEVLDQHLEDIIIGEHRYIWNMQNVEWILREGSVDEIGCIHTTQGYDLNYVGVILGSEIDYDESRGEIIIYPDRFHDKYVKQGADYETLKRYIINSYRVMMTRGIKGCYIYVCNPALRKYLQRFL